MSEIMDGKNIAYMTLGDLRYGGTCIHDCTLVNNIRKTGTSIKLYSVFYDTYSDEKISNDGVYFKMRDVLLAHHIPRYYNLPVFSWPENPIKKIPYLNDINFSRRNSDASYIDSFSKNALKDLNSLLFRLVPANIKQRMAFEIFNSLEAGVDGKLRREILLFKNRLKKDKVELLNTCSVMWSRIVSDIKDELGMVNVATLQLYDIFYSSFSDEDKSKILYLLRQDVKKTDAFIAISNHYAKKASSELKIPMKKMNVVYNGIDIEKYRPVDVRKDSGVFTITYLGRISIEKGIVNLIIAAKHLIDCGYKHFRVNLVGDATIEYLASINAYISLFKMNRFFTVMSNISLQEKVELFNKSDIVVYPTAFPEPFGLVPVEAMACGTPVVVPDHGAFPEIIKETKGGLLFRPNDPYDLAKKIIMLMESKDKCEELSEDGLRNVREKFNAKLMAEKVLEVYDDMLD